MENLSFKIDARASSGNIEKLFHGSSSYGCYLGIDWKVNSQSASSNSSNVTATVYIRTTGSGVSISSSAKKNVSLTINGTKYTSTCTVGISTNSKKNLFSKTVTVGHNSDGSKTCTFACDLAIAVTLSGTYYGTISHSGKGTFNQINLNTAPVWVSGGRITIKNGSKTLTDSASGTENAVKFPENVSVLNLSWSGATDADNDTITYELYEQVDNGSWNNIYTGTAKTYDRTIGAGSSTQGKMYDYYLKARDSKNAYASGTQDATQVQKNVLNGSTLASSSSIVSSTSSIAFTWNAGSNTDGSPVNYDLTASGVTIYRATNLTATSLNIAIVDTAPASGAYILKSDLKNKFASSSYNGNLTFTLTTKNNYSSSKTSTKTISVDLRTNPTPAKPTIDKSANSTAYHKVATTGVFYFVPDGTKTIRVNWSGGSDSLGTSLKYDVQVKIGSGSFETKHSNLTTTSCDIVLPKQTAQQTFVVRVITKTAYNFTKESDTTAEYLEYYNPPSVEVTKINRTSTGVTATIKLNANTSIPNVNFPTRTYSGVSSGTLTNTRNAQDITASGLVDTNKYTWTITVKDDVGLYTTNVVKTIEIPAYTPLFSVREKGVGVNAIPDGSAKLIVNGGVKVSGDVNINTMRVGRNGNGWDFIGNNTSGLWLKFYDADSKIEFNSNNLYANSNRIYHQGYKPTTADISAIKAISANGYWGMSAPDGNASNWIRTTSNGIIPYQSGGSGSLGTSSWQFNTVYAKTLYEDNVALSSKYLGLTGGTITGLTSFNRGSATQAVIVQTQGDSNANGDGNTHLGYYSNGAYHHYFRGKGTTIIDTHGGLNVNNAPINALKGMYTGDYTDSFTGVFMKRSTNSQNYQARYGVSYGNIKLASSSTSTMTYGAVIESHNTSSAQARYLFGNTCFTPLTDNNKYCGTSSHRWSALYASTGTVYSSSKDEKDNIVPLNISTYGTKDFNLKDLIKQGLKETNMYTYTYRAIDNSSAFVGFLGQELEEQNKPFFDLIGTSYITEEGNKQYDIRETSVIGVLWSALQDALIENETQEERISELEEQVENLSNELKEIRDMLSKLV